MIKKKAKVLKEECVACGRCKKVCPRGAISIKRGMYSQVDENLCVGCKKCIFICPANVIELIEVEV
ncbi:ATP-binding protein [[Clostridium] colinum]|uniref:ATP-binding protein n=1 Tax=[Clostridium] colinum TaxID=36835 RepID=UPI002024DE55|nr:4Fe-4S binding protein [[Clostridium] colinum]